MSYQWRPIESAPLDTSWVTVRLKNGDEYKAHYAEDLSGSDQPAFKGWFGDSGDSFVELPSWPVEWKPLMDCQDEKS